MIKKSSVIREIKACGVFICENYDQSEKVVDILLPLLREGKLSDKFTGRVYSKIRVKNSYCPVFDKVVPFVHCK